MCGYAQSASFDRRATTDPFATLRDDKHRGSTKHLNTSPKTSPTAYSIPSPPHPHPPTADNQDTNTYSEPLARACASPQSRHIDDTPVRAGHTPTTDPQRWLNASSADCPSTSQSHRPHHPTHSPACNAATHPPSAASRPPSTFASRETDAPAPQSRLRSCTHCPARQARADSTTHSQSHRQDVRPHASATRPNRHRPCNSQTKHPAPASPPSHRASTKPRYGTPLQAH